jgi:electron transfer flavoprotein alpha subunit
MVDVLTIIEDVADGAAELANAARSLGDVKTTALICDASEQSTALLTNLFDHVVVFPASADQCWDAEWIAACALSWLQDHQPDLVLLQHTNNGLDLAPLLAAKSNRPMLADCFTLEFREQELVATRSVFGGKVHAKIVATQSDHGYLATLRPGAFSAEETQAGSAATIENAPPPESYQARRRCLETLTPDAGAVDITQAEILVGVGRGIEEEDNLEMVRDLAGALGAELACTRPVVDKQWLEKSRQVGTSGLTVKPKIYITVGVSGSFQHLGGVKGGPFIVAINQDPAAPIFASADVGIVGDLFDLVPLLEEKIRERKG